LQPDNATEVWGDNARVEPPVNRPPEHRIARGEILCAMIKGAVIGTTGRHASADTPAFLEYPHFMAGIAQQTRAGKAGDTCTDNRYA
jgi:hypothetical protein